MKIAIIGAGRLAATLAPALHRAGYIISEIVSPGRAASRCKARSLARAVGAQVAVKARGHLNADLFWFCVPDGKIGETAREMAEVNWKGRYAFHSSGALLSAELGTLRKRGAAVASVHPLMTSVSGAHPVLQGVPFALEGDRPATALARKIVKDLGGIPFAMRAKGKVLYHAWGTFASPLLTSLLATSEQVAIASGLSIQDARSKMLPILQQTLANYAALGPAKAFSGPIIRGDAEVLRRQLDALKKVPEARKVYVALGSAALHFLPTRNRRELRKIFLSEL